MYSEHLCKFLELSDESHIWPGAKIANWWSDVFPNRPTKLPFDRVCRDELKNIARVDSPFSDLEVFVAIMAWGGMRRNNGRRFAMSGDLSQTCEIIGGLREGKLDRGDAFSRFFGMRKSGRLSGVSAAYYTKLIFFCGANHNGYIMDQWTSKSVNLICEDPVVHLTYAGHVSDKNDAGTYSEFCDVIEELARKGKWTPEKTEMRLFSHGGRKKGAWRQYVVDHS